MMKKAWGRIEDRNMEQFEIIDIRSKEEVTDSWKDFIHTHHYDYRTSFFDSSLALYPRRTDEAYFCHFLPLSPEEAFIEDHPKFIKKIEKEAVAKTIRTIERMLKKGASMEKIRSSFGIAK